MVGLPVEYTTEIAEDGRQRKIYTPTQKEYTTKIVVEYVRVSDNLSIIKEVDGTLVLGGTSLPPLGVTSTQEIQGSLFIPRVSTSQTESHFWWNESNEGYYSRYFDALLLLKWKDDSHLNRYMGYYAQTQDVCYGHYENASSSTWTRYASASVLSNSQIDEYISKVPDLVGGVIGYDGSNNWSALAIEKEQLPMKVHYVHGDNGENTSLKNSDVKFDITMTAEYPIIVKEGLYGVIAAENPSTYSLKNENIYMDVLTVPTKLNNAYVSNVNISTGVEGIITDACGGVTLYPNPVGSSFTLRAPMTIKNVKIFTMSGQVVKIVNDCDDTTVSINVEELPKGLYIVNTLGISQIMIKQ